MFRKKKPEWRVTLIVARCRADRETGHVYRTTEFGWHEHTIPYEDLPSMGDFVVIGDWARGYVMEIVRDYKNHEITVFADIVLK